MMPPSNLRPKWWQLYVTVPLLFGLFLFEGRLKLTQRGHIAVQMGILLVVYGLIHIWLKANAAAPSQMDRDQYRGTIRVIRVPVAPLIEIEDENRPLLHLPGSEVKGVLSDTFEMDYIDAETFPVDEVPSDGRVNGGRSVPSYRDYR